MPHLIPVEQAHIGAAEITAFTKSKFSRVEFKDRTAIRRVSRGQRRKQRQRRFDPPLNRAYEPVDAHLLNKRLLTRIDAARTSA